MNQQAPAPPIYWLIWATITAAFFLAVGIFETAATPAGLFALILSSPWKTPLAAAALVLIIAYIPSFIIQRP
jgi:hypothetical protein